MPKIRILVIIHLSFPAAAVAKILNTKECGKNLFKTDFTLCMGLIPLQFVCLRHKSSHKPRYQSLMTVWVLVCLGPVIRSFFFYKPGSGYVIQLRCNLLRLNVRLYLYKLLYLYKRNRDVDKNYIYNGLSKLPGRLNQL